MKNEAIVLGAFGCGAFRTVEFAVYGRPGDSVNYDAFVNVLRQGAMF